MSISLIDTDAYILEKFLYFLESEGRLYDVPIRRDNTQAQKLELDLLFSFPAFLEYQHLKDIFSLVDINTKELK